MESEAKAHGGFAEVELVDLAVVNLPLLDEPHNPRRAEYTHQHTKDWSAKIGEADAFVFVMPEYNGSFPAPLKNAVDYLAREWAYKPVGMVGYGGSSGGLRSAESIKPVVLAVGMLPVNGVGISFPHERLDENRRLIADEQLAAAAARMLRELVRLSDALHPLRG